MTDRLDPWRHATPTPLGCTWGVTATGDAFVAAMQAAGWDGEPVLEAGPGYGRLFTAALRTYPDVEWYGVDLSSEVVAHCCGLGMTAWEGNAATDALDVPAQVAVSSLVFKHQHPDFTALLANLLRAVPVVMFDVPFGPYVEDRDAYGFLRGYTLEEITHCVEAAHGTVRSLSEVDHNVETAAGPAVRHFVVAQRAAG